MKSIMATYEKETDVITIDDSNEWENWSAICKKFYDDVHRVRDVDDHGEYTGLYECLDDDNKKFYYLVEEDAKLFRMKRKNFLKAVGKSI
ncbi:MAG: hypothetical protein GY859_06720 [Desulfobacterales bacterium]|nr:hypothetical protein [Desulfobacterales bacterium]